MEERVEVLSGGNVNQVVKIGDTVRRSVSGSPAIHSYLLYLEQAGMEGVPRFIGLDGNGREILSFLPGKTMGSGYPPYHPCICSDETLTDLARFMRTLHDAGAGFLGRAAEEEWESSYFPQEQWETICHNDAATYNLVFVDDRLSGLIDFDVAYPGPRIWDLSYTLYSTVPLTAIEPEPELEDCVSYNSDKHSKRRRRRINMFFDAYGMQIPAEFMNWVLKRIEALCDTLSSGAAAGNKAYAKMIREGHLDHYKTEIEFLKAHGSEWV